MTVSFEVKVYNSAGVYINSVQGFDRPADQGGARLEYALVVGGVGVCLINAPTNYNDAVLSPDIRLGIYKTIDHRPSMLDGDAIFLAQRFEFAEKYITVLGLHANSLMGRRIINYYNGTAYSSKTGNADDLIKTYWKENAGASVVTADRIGSDSYADISSFVATEANRSQGVSVSMRAAYRNLLRVVQDLCQASENQGTYLAAEIVSSSGSNLRLQTWSQFRGVDRRAGATGTPILLGPGPLSNMVIVEDYSDEANFVLTAGQGTGTSRATATSASTTRMSATPLARKEVFIEDRATLDTNELQLQAYAETQARKPQKYVSANLVDVPGYTRGVDYDIGDGVTCQLRNRKLDCRLDMVYTKISAEEYTQQARFRGII